MSKMRKVATETETVAGCASGRWESNQSVGRLEFFWRT